MPTDYTVQLDAFEGPLDLLLYLTRQAEVDIADIPIAEITEQYLGFLEHLDRIDIDKAGEFLLMAATLMEIKSRLLQPREAGSERTDRSKDEEIDPRAELIEQLLAYKRYRDAADAFEARLESWSRRFPTGKAAHDKDALREASGEDELVDLGDVDALTLARAFAAISESVNFERLGEHEVLDDDTPIELHQADLVDRLQRAEGSSLSLRSVFEGRRRGEMIGLFIATLELVRQRKLSVAVDDAGEVTLGLREPEPEAVSQEETE
ncbi:MAG: segregation/condensation protein A [Planctomycetota bacterium]